MQQNSRKKSMPKRLCVTNVTGPLLVCLFIYYKRTSLKEDEVWKKIFSNKNYCHVLDTRFAIFFPLPSYCVMYGSIRSFNIPPGNPPGIWLFWKLLFKFPPHWGPFRVSSYKAFFKKIPPIEITTSWQIHWHASSLTLLINIQAAGQSNWPLLSFLLLYWIAGIGIVIHYKHNLIHSYIQSLNPILKNIKI